jgi:hypothetical protein
VKIATAPLRGRSCPAPHHGRRPRESRRGPCLCAASVTGGSVDASARPDLLHDLRVGRSIEEPVHGGKDDNLLTPEVIGDVPLQLGGRRRDRWDALGVLKRIAREHLARAHQRDDGAFRARRALVPSSSASTCGSLPRNRGRTDSSSSLACSGMTVHSHPSGGAPRIRRAAGYFAGTCSKSQVER